MTACASAMKPQIAQMLTGCELDILKLMADGNHTKEIAFILDMSVASVLKHRAHAMHKFGIHNAANLVQFAVWNGLLVPQGVRSASGAARDYGK